MAIDFGALISMFACVLACTTAAARVLMRMAHCGLLPAEFERTSPGHGTPGAAVILSAALMFAATAAFGLQGYKGSAMYDLCGSLSVFGFLTAMRWWRLRFPSPGAPGPAFRLRHRHQHPHHCVMLLIVIFDLQSSSDPVHARIPYLYMAYLAAGLAWYAMKRRQKAMVQHRDAPR